MRRAHAPRLHYRLLTLGAQGRGGGARTRGLKRARAFADDVRAGVAGLDKEIKPYGCGPFVYESYLIFCCGHGTSIQATDKNLRAYCAWLRGQPETDAPSSSALAPVDAIDVP